MLIEQTPSELLKEELERLDNLLGAARSFHYSAFILSGLSLAFSALEKVSEIKLPIVDVVIPALQAIIGTYLLVLVFTLASERFFNMAYPWLKLDKRRPPFAWIALGSQKPTVGSVTFWLMLPVCVCAISTSISLDGKDPVGFALSYGGLVFVLIPRAIDIYWYLIRKKLDHRGGPATFSIWLLYWYRLARSFTLSAIFLIPIIAIIPKWRIDALRAEPPLIIFSAVMVILRLIAGFPLVYRLIDRIGSKLGFPKESKHYK